MKNLYRCFFRRSKFVTRKFERFSAKEMVDYIRQKKVESDDEWFEIKSWIHEFLKSNPPKEEKRLFVPLGLAERVCIICDGIKRWRMSICSVCRRTNHEKYPYSCEIYKKNKVSDKGIPSEIWAKENAECAYFEEKE